MRDEDSREVTRRASDEDSELSRGNDPRLRYDIPVSRSRVSRSNARGDARTHQMEIALRLRSIETVAVWFFKIMVRSNPLIKTL